MAMQYAVVEYEVGLEIIMVDEDSLLSSLETEPLTQFHKERLKIVEDSSLKLGFGIDFCLRDAEELKCEGITQVMVWLHGFMSCGEHVLLESFLISR